MQPNKDIAGALAVCERVLAADAAATPGPWELFGGSIVESADGGYAMEWIANGKWDKRTHDGEFVALARNAAPAMAELILALFEEERATGPRAWNKAGKRREAALAKLAEAAR